MKIYFAWHGNKHYHLLAAGGQTIVKTAAGLVSKLTKIES